jgi:hypothetical protein
VHAVTADDAVAALRLLCDRRDEFVAARTQAVCRLYRLLAGLSRSGASAVSGLPGRVAGIGWVVVVPRGPAFSPGVILADMQLEEGVLEKRSPHSGHVLTSVAGMPSSWLCLYSAASWCGLAGGMYADSGSLAAIQEALPAAPCGGCA